MRKTENGFTGNEQHSAMARLSLDDMIDQLLHSNALSLKLTANPLLADRAWYLTENTCTKALPPTIRKRKTCPRALFKLYQAWLAEPLSAAAKPVSSITLRDRSHIESEWLRVEKNVSVSRYPRLTPGISLRNSVIYVRNTRLRTIPL